jgi:hypothetical protein
MHEHYQVRTTFVSASENEFKHVYRPIQRYLYPVLLIQILLGVMGSLLLCFNSFALIAIGRRTGSVPAGIILVDLFLLALLLLVTFPTIMGLVGMKLETSANGIRYSYWPNYTIECKWSDIDRLGEGTTGKIKYDVLYLSGGKVMELAPTMKMRRLFFNPSKQYYIPLARMEGWPDGELANDIRHYAPHLFEKHDQQ